MPTQNPTPKGPLVNSSYCCIVLFVVDQSQLVYTKIIDLFIDQLLICYGLTKNILVMSRYKSSADVLSRQGPLGTPGVQTDPMPQADISAPRVMKRPFHISLQLNRNAFCGAGAPVDQHPGPPLHLIVLF